MVSDSILVQSWDYILWGVIHSSPFILPSFIFMALGIRPQHYGFVAGSLILFILFEDSSSMALIKDLSSTLGIRPLFSLLWFYPLSHCRFVYSDYRRLISIVIAWIRPLFLIKIGFMAVIIIFSVWLYFGIRRKLLR